MLSLRGGGLGVKKAVSCLVSQGLNQSAEDGDNLADKYNFLGANIVMKFHDIQPDHAVPIQKSGYSVKKVGCCNMVISDDTGPMLKINQTSQIIWNLCNGELNIGSIISSLQDAFPENKDEIKKDVLRIIDTFNAEEVIDITL